METPKFCLETLCKEIANGDAAAEEFCLLFANFAHWIDDVIDDDRVWNVEDTARLTLAVLLTFGFNSFVQRYKQALLPLIIAGSNAWLASLEWAKREDLLDRVAAGVLKTAYAETLFFVAYLTGGSEHYDAMTRKHRKYSYD